MRTLDLIPLSVTEVQPGLHERAEGITNIPVYRLSWPRKPVQLWKWRMPGTEKGSGNYIKKPVEKLNLPPEAGEQYQLRKSDTTTKTLEIAAFLETQLTGTHINVILAARIANEWFELYRWNSSWKQLGCSEARVSED